MTKTSQVLGKQWTEEDLKVFLSNLLNLSFGFTWNWQKELFSGGGPHTIKVRAGTDVREGLMKPFIEARPEDWRHIARFAQRYSSLIPDDPIPNRHLIWWLYWLQLRIRQTWLARNDRERQHGVWWVIHSLVAADAGNLFDKERALVVPEETGLERALQVFLKNSALAKICENPKCQTPYFFAGRAFQRFCSINCGKPALRAAKLDWWNKNRKELKKKRAKR